MVAHLLGSGKFFLSFVVAVNLLCILEPSTKVLAAERQATTGKIKLKFPVSDPELAIYRDGAEVAFRSARTSVEDTDKHRLLSLYLTNVEGAGCEWTIENRPEGASFVVKVTILLPKGAQLSPGEKKELKELSLTFVASKSSSFRVNGPLGSVTLKSVGDVVKGSVSIDSDYLQVSGDFSAVQCK